MEYQVPQFIEVEDKVVGPLTLKQFIYLAGAAGLCVLLFTSLPKVVAVLLALPIAGFAAALAFYKVNGKPFVEVVEAGFNYYTRAKLFLWKREEEGASASPAAAASPNTKHAGPRLTRGRLSELAWSLDVKASGDEAEHLQS